MDMKKKRRTLYTMLIIICIAILGFMVLLLISENASALKILLVDDDGEVGKPTENSGNGQGFVKSMIAYGLVENKDFTIVDCGGYTGNPDFSGLNLHDYDILIWQGYYAWDHNYFGGKLMAQTMINDFFMRGKMVWWSDCPYAGYYYYNDNNLKGRWFKMETNYCYCPLHANWFNLEAKVWGIDNNVINTSKIRYKMNVSDHVPNTYGYWHYFNFPLSGAEAFLKFPDPKKWCAHEIGAIAYQNDTFGYQSILMGNFFNNIKNDTDRNKVFETIIDWYNSKDREGDGELISPVDNSRIQKEGKGDNDIEFMWKYKDPNLIETNPMSYYLFLSRQVKDIIKMVNELSIAKYIDANGNPDVKGDLNPFWNNRDPENYNGFVAKIDDNYTDIDENGYSNNTFTFENIEDGIWYWGVLAEEISSPTKQRFRTPLTGSEYYRTFYLDTKVPSIVFSMCEPVLPNKGEDTKRHLNINSENSELVPTNERPFTLVVTDIKTKGFCSGIDINKTMNTFDFAIYISSYKDPILDKSEWEECCEFTYHAVLNEEAPYKVTFEWALKDEYKNILKGTVNFYFNFTLYDNFGNVNPENESWHIQFNIDVESPKAPLTPSIEFYKGEGGKTDYVWLGDKTYKISTTGPSRYSIDEGWYDDSMNTVDCGIQFGRIRDGRTSVDWEGGDLIGFMSTPEAYADNEGPATYYWIDFIPDVDDIAYVARSIDWGKNTNESEQLTGDDGKQFVVDKEGPVAPTWETDIIGENINDDGTIFVEGIVKEDLPKKKGCGIRSVTVYAEGKDKSGKWSVEENHSLTAFLYDVIDENAGDYTELLEGRFKISKLPLWPGVNRIYAIANDLLDNPIKSDRIDFEDALWTYSEKHPEIKSEPLEILVLTQDVIGENLQIPGMDDFHLTFSQLPSGFYWMKGDRKDNPTELPKWPRDAFVGTLNPIYWHVETNLNDGFQAAITIEYYNEAGGPANTNDDLRVIANSDKEDNWELVSSDPPTKYGNKYKCVFTVDHFTDFAIIELNPRPYALIDKVTMDHDTILSGETLRISAKLVNEGTFTKDSGSKENPIEVSFDAKNIKTGEVINLGTRELAGGVLKAGETDAYVNITWVIPKKGEYIITATLDPNGTAAPSAPGYSVEDTGRFEALEVEEVTTSFASSLWTDTIAVSLVVVFSAVNRRKR